MEHGKTEMFYFSKSHRVFDPPSLDLSSLGGPILYPRKTWRYLGFIFDRKLSFCQHINFYANKAILIVKCMKTLRNSVCGLIPHQKYLLYKSCVLIALYRFQLWFYNKALLSYPPKELRKIQRRVVILGTFQMSPSFNIKVIVGLVPIFTFENSVEEYNSEHMSSLIITSFIHYLNQDLIFTTITIISYWIHLLCANKKGLKVLSLIWIIGLMKYFLLLTSIISSFLPVLELLTFFLVIFLSIL